MFGPLLSFFSVSSVSLALLLEMLRSVNKNNFNKTVVRFEIAHESGVSLRDFTNIPDQFLIAKLHLTRAPNVSAPQARLC